MKSTLLRLSSLLLTFSVGVSIPQFFKHHSSESSLAVSSSGVASVVSSRCPGPEYTWKGGGVVIEVPNDTEIYLQKRKVGLSEISGSVRKMVAKVTHREDLVVLIKIDAGVRFETVSLISDQLKSANVECFDFIMDKKKGGLK